MHAPSRLAWIKTVREHLIAPLLDFLPLPNINPTIVTLLALPLSAGFFLLWPVSRIGAVVCLILAFVSDGLDGAIARKYHRASARGWWIDAITDRVSEIILFLRFPVPWLYFAGANVVLLFIGLGLRRNITINWRFLFLFWLFFAFVVFPNNLVFTATAGKVFLELLWFFLPIGFANLVPFLVRHHWNWMAVPMDFGKSYRGKRILGDHKTLRGFIFAGAIAGLVYAGQRFLYETFDGVQAISVIDYGTTTLWLGILMGFGAMVGDMVKSFFKRQRGVAPGEMWFPWDKIDYLLGAFVFVAFFVWPGWWFALGVVILGSVGSMFMDHLGYYMGMRRTKW